MAQFVADHVGAFSRVDRSMQVAFRDATVEKVQATVAGVKGVEIHPLVQPDVHRLLHGRYPEGWAEYHWRWAVPGHPRAIVTRPEWDGASLAGKSILLIAEQGHGDIFEFVRYARLYRPAAIVCWSPRARAFCRDNPDLVTILDDDGFVLIGRVLGFGGATISGRARVEARRGGGAQTTGPGRRRTR